jgi:hypothetical protein
LSGRHQGNPQQADVGRLCRRIQAVSNGLNGALRNATGRFIVTAAFDPLRRGRWGVFDFNKSESSMIGTIRRHNKLLWMILVPVTIFSFAYYFFPNNRNGSGGREDGSGVNCGSIDGESITVDQLREAMREGRIFFRLNYGEWPDNSEAKQKDLRRFAEQRLVLNYELENYHIAVSTEAAARFLRQVLGVKPEDNISPAKIVEALTKLGQEGGVSLEDFTRFARHQAGQEYLVALIGMTGKLITPKEAEVFYRRENEPIQTELVRFPAASYYNKTTPDKKDIEDFYSKREADYRVPDRITINYIQFDASNNVAKVEKQLGTNLDEHVTAQYLQANPASFKDESGKQLSATEAKAKIKKQTILYYSLLEARKDANAFMQELTEGHDEQHPYTQADLAKLAQAHKFTVKTSAPFDQQTPPKGLDLSPKSLHVLFSLRNDDPDDKERSMIYAESPLVGEDEVYVAGLRDRTPSKVEPLSAVYDKVVEDYRQSEALKASKAAGERFEQALEAGLTQGKTFDTMCAAQFVRPKALTPFSLSTPSIPEVTDKEEYYQMQDLAGRMHPGQFSPFMATADGGYLLYVKGHLPVDESVVKRDVPLYLARMRERFQIAAFNAWFSKQYQLHYVAPPDELSATGG